MAPRSLPWRTCDIRRVGYWAGNHPDRPGDYLVGVECDGATYHSAATARDRDKVRGEILRSLGWRLVRVWSTEWWIDRDGALERLHEAIGAALEEQRARAAEVKRAGKVDAEAAAKAMEAEGAAIVARDTERDHDEGDRAVSDPMVAEGERSEEPEPMRLVARGPSGDGVASTARPYRMADLTSLEASIRRLPQPPVGTLPTLGMRSLGSER